MQPSEAILAKLGVRSQAEARRQYAQKVVDNPYDAESAAILAVVLTLPKISRLGGDPPVISPPLPQTGYNGQRTTDNRTAMQWARAKAYNASDATVLIEGETGTGKEGLARLIHGSSTAPFVAVNCGGFTDTLVESELFGYERGAFTGANTRKQGVLESAGEGTVFLDEIGELPLMTQVRLLRVLQERSFRRIGSDRDLVPFKARVVAATHRNLKHEVAQGRFREDLYYRLAVLRLHTQPLRNRIGDVLMLADTLAKPFTIHPDAQVMLSQHTWPGNVRELQNTMTRAKTFASFNAREQIIPQDLELDISVSGI